MKEGLLDTIKSRGYWRINIRPIIVPDFELLLEECREIIVENNIEIRGWDYPHISTRNDENGGLAPAGAFFENWVDWANHKEFWRMYRTSQFLHYLALREDWLELDPFGNANDDLARPGRSLNIVGSVYQITEILEFCFRLFGANLYQSGLILTIDLRNSQGRELWIDAHDRIPFSFPRVTAAENISLKIQMTPQELSSRSLKFSQKILFELFDNFSWSPKLDQIERDQIRFMNRQF